MIIRPTFTAATAVLALAACSGGAARGTVPEALVEVPEIAGGATPDVTEDRGELILRSGGKDIGHEVFTMSRDGAWMKIAVTAATTFPDPIAIEAALWVEPATWRVDRYDLHVDRAGTACTFRLRNRGQIVEVEVEHADGTREVIDREPRQHAEYYVSLRPTVSQGAICARAGDRPRAFESFSPWYIVRAAPRTPSTIPTADGARRLDLVRVDDSIDVYCDGPQLAIVHYAAHAFVAARTEYDAAAQALAAGDPTDALWAGELACPIPKP